MWKTSLLGLVVVVASIACSGADRPSGPSGSAGQGGAAGGPGGQGGAAACQIDGDCPPGFCLVRRCIDGACSAAPAPAGTPCPEGACDASGLCVDPCTDGAKDGDETDVDCGGATCGVMLGARCDLGEGCLVHDDCFTGNCCAPPAGVLGTCISAAEMCTFM